MKDAEKYRTGGMLTGHQPPSKADYLEILRCGTCGWTYLRQYGGVALVPQPDGGCDNPGGPDLLRYELIKESDGDSPTLWGSVKSMTDQRVTVRRLGTSTRGLTLGVVHRFVDECERLGFPIDTEVAAMIGADAPEMRIGGLVSRAVVRGDDE